MSRPAHCTVILRLVTTFDRKNNLILNILAFYYKSVVKTTFYNDKQAAKAACLINIEIAIS